MHRSRGDDELFVKLDALQLQQAMLNLVLNARDAMPFGGDLHLQVKAWTSAAQDAARADARAPM